MKKYLFPMLLLALFSVGFTASDEDDTIIGGNPGSSAGDLEELLGIVELKDDAIGAWDAAYLTKFGYFCYKENASFGDGDDSDEYSSITYLPTNSGPMVSLLATKSDNLPTQMVIQGGGVVYFSFPNDTILELLYDDGKTVMMFDSVAYSKTILQNLIKNHDGDAFKAALEAAASLLTKNKATGGISGATEARYYGDIFAQISKQSYIQNDELVSTIKKITSGIYEFTEIIRNWYDEQIRKYIYNTLYLWTGKATFKVGGSSCTLSATIWCPSSKYNDYGTYGILCDENQANLTVGNAEYEGTGRQPKGSLSYSVDFRGFKPNTTYYYRAYYKFNDSNHGNISPKYGNQTDQVIYDTTIKSFTTGDNVLTVDVVMCIDVTGSMSPIINTVKNNALSFYDLFNQSCIEEGIQLYGLNTQVIAFRDKNVDGSSWLQTSPTYSLPSQTEAYRSFVNNLYANGGGDAPESGLEALETAFNKTDWGVDDGYHRQVVILWTDAPYLIGSYSDIDLSTLESQWNAMPSGRRLVLFAPNGSSSNGGSWGNLDGWTNLIHETDLESGFKEFDYILKSIIGELTSKGKARTIKTYTQEVPYFRPNN